MGLGTISRKNLTFREMKNFLSLEGNWLKAEPQAPESIIIIIES